MPDNAVHRFTFSARRPAALAAIAAVWLILLGLYLLWDARWWILAPFAILTLPAIWDAAKGKQSHLEVDGVAVSWSTGGGRNGSELIANIKRVGIRTRLDFSRRVRLYLADDRVVTIPPDCTPSGSQMERIFASLGIEIRREFIGG